MDKSSHMDFGAVIIQIPLHIMMSQHSSSLATATAAILVHNENLLRLGTKMAAVSMAKGCMQSLYKEGMGIDLTRSLKITNCSNCIYAFLLLVWKSC